MQNLHKLRVRELRQIASKYEIEGRSKARTKKQLVNLLTKRVSKTKLTAEIRFYDVARRSPRSFSPGKPRYILQKSTNAGKKWMVTTPTGKKVHFGSAGMSDYTKHKDPARKQRYISRHAGNKDGTTSRRENWTKSGKNTPGFWSRWLLWGEPTLQGSINKIKQKFGIDIVRKSGSPSTPRRRQ